MKRFIASTLIVGFAAGAAIAAEYDADGDGLVTFDEILVVVPTMTEEAFTQVDTDGDGTLNADEIAAAEEAGVIPAAG